MFGLEFPRLPDVKFPELTLPEFRFPELPKIDLPEWHIPEISIPDIQIPQPPPIHILPIDLPKPEELVGEGVKAVTSPVVKPIADAIKATGTDLGSGLEAFGGGIEQLGRGIGSFLPEQVEVKPEIAPIKFPDLTIPALLVAAALIFMGGRK